MTAWRRPRPLHRVRWWLPSGGKLPDAVWAQRHRAILAVLWLHVPAVTAYGVIRGEEAGYLAFSTTILVLLSTAATLARGRRSATVLTAVGLLTCSAVLVHDSRGLIEMHSHFFVVVGIVTLYQDWWPFLVAIAYVVLQHGVGGVIDPGSVYDHADAVANPWQWAGVHGLFVLAMSTTGVASWRLNEAFLGRVADREASLSETQRAARVAGWEYDLEAEQFRPSDDLVGMLGAAADGAALRALLDATDADGRDVCLTVDGQARWFHTQAHTVVRSDRPAGVVSGIVQDVTERKRAEDHVRGTLSVLQATLDATSDGILVVDRDGRIASFNNRFVEMWQIPEPVLASRDDEQAIGFVLDQLCDPAAFIAKVQELYANPDAESRDMLEFLDGRIFERSSKPQRVDGVTVGRVWSFHDMTERARLERELAHQAFHDPLTDLANQALFRDRVDHALARSGRSANTLAVLFLDVDNFKNVNDSLGHTAGDELLVEVAARLRRCLRAADTAARLGGDEFAVLVEDVADDGEVVAVAERIIDAMRQPFSRHGRSVAVSASVGVAYASEGDATADLLLRNADLAMYTAKRNGKDRHAVYETEMHTDAVARLDLHGDLRHAAANGELVAWYQPIVDLNTGAAVGTEALVRWQHPVRGLLTPDAFIGAAEETGLVIDLGREMLRQACRQLAAWRSDRPDLYVSVNLSARQLHDPNLVADVTGALRDAGIDGGGLVLEITETAMMQDPEVAISILHELRALGIRIAVDDFGTGYSSLSYLQRFPVDILKVDRTFVRDIHDGEQQVSFVRTILSLAGTLGLATTAEGIETPEQAETLRGLGCATAQGFLFARPAPATEVAFAAVAAVG